MEFSCFHLRELLLFVESILQNQIICPSLLAHLFAIESEQEFLLYDYFDPLISIKYKMVKIMTIL